RRSEQVSSLRLVARLALVLCVAVLVTACGGGNEFAPLQRGDEAPAYGARTLNGDTLALTSLDGRPVMLNVWATWCPPCREEMPALQTLHERYDTRGLAVVAVSLDAA